MNDKIEAINSHSVWEVYNQLREVLFLVKLYNIKLNKMKKTNFIIEFLLSAISSSLLAGLWFLNTPDGQKIFKILLLIPALLSIIKTIINFQENILQVDRMLSLYQVYYNDLLRLKIKISHDRAYTNEHKEEFLDILKRNNVIDNIYVEVTTDKKLLYKIKKEVSEKYPPESFFIPND